MQSLRKTILGVFALLILVAGYFFMQFLVSLKKDPPKRPASTTKQYVKTEVVKYGAIETFIEASGRVSTG